MDARERDECEEGRIPGVVRVPLSRLHGRFEVAEERDKTGKRIGIRGRISDGQNTSPSSSGWREAALLSAALTLHAEQDHPAVLLFCQRCPAAERGYRRPILQGSPRRCTGWCTEAPTKRRGLLLLRVLPAKSDKKESRRADSAR